MEAIGATAAGTLLVAWPSFHAGTGAALASTAMNFVMMLTFGSLSWLTWNDPIADEKDDTREGPHAKPKFRDESWQDHVNVAIIGHHSSGKSSLVNALLELQKPGRRRALVGLEGETEAPGMYMVGTTKEIESRMEERRNKLQEAQKATDEKEEEQLQSAPSAGLAGVVDEADGGAGGSVCNDKSTQLPPPLPPRKASSVAANLVLARPLLAGNAPPSSGPETCRRDIQLRLWDMPGIDEHSVAIPDYCAMNGLVHFDAVIVVYSELASALEMALLSELKDVLRVPTTLVRSQVDLDIEAAKRLIVEGVEPDCPEILRALRAQAEDEGAPFILLTSSAEPGEYDLPALLEDMLGLLKVRGRACCNMDVECPICFESFVDGKGRKRLCQWCSNAVCEGCANTLQEKGSYQGVVLNGNSDLQAMCPFCRRWTHLRRRS